MGAASLEEALEKSRPLLEEWETYFDADAAPMHKDDSPYWALKEKELAVLRLKALWMSDPEVAKELGLPVSTVSGRRVHALAKLKVGNWQEGVTKALDLGLIGPDEPSMRLLWRICDQTASGKLKAPVIGGRVVKPSRKQIEALKEVSKVPTLMEAARRMGCTDTNVRLVLQRVYRLFGAEDLRGALKRVTELGLTPQAA